MTESLPPPGTDSTECVSLTVGERCLTSTNVGCYVLKLIYLADSLSPGEVKDEDPVA